MAYSGNSPTEGLYSGYYTWLQDREDHARLLFGEPEGYTPEAHAQLDTDLPISLAHLALTTKLSRPTKYEQFSRGEIEDSVSAILTHHDAAARGDECGEVIFGLVDPDKDLPRVEALTSQVIWIWERAWTWHNKREGVAETDNPSPFAELPTSDIESADFDRTDVQLVIETASAVIEVLETGYPSGRPGGEYSSKVGRFVAKYGPSYARDWISGGVISRYCAEHGHDAEQWLRLVPHGMRADLAVSNRDPLRALIRYMAHFEQVLNIENISKETGLDEQEVAVAFSEALRMKLALRFANDPMKGVKKIVEALQTTLKVERLASEFGLPSEQIENIFPTYVRVKIALSPHPLAEVKRITALLASDLDTNVLVDELGWNQGEVERVFSQNMLTLLALTHKNPLTKVRIIAKNYELLSTNNLVANLPLNPQQVDMLFNTRTCILLARNYKNPIEIAQRMAQTYRELVGMYPLRPATLARLATFRWKSAHKLAEQIMTEQADCPSDISPDAWASIIVSYPNPKDPQRTKQLSAYRALLRIRYPLSLDAVSLNEQTLYDNEADNTMASAMESASAVKIVRHLAERAGLTTDQLEALLDHFSVENPLVANENSNISDLLERLRQAGVQTGERKIS